MIDEPSYSIIGHRIFIKGLTIDGKFGRMPNIKIEYAYAEGSIRYRMTYKAALDDFIFYIDHLMVRKSDLINGLTYFLNNRSMIGIPGQIEVLIRQAIDILKEDHRDRKEDMYNEDVYDLIEAADKCRKEIVLCLLGKPGIGKTEAVEKFARDHNRNVVHIITSQILPSEVSGMTMPNQETHSMDVFDHYRLSHMKDGDILFFDELLKGQQQVLNACLTLIQERRLMSGTKLPDVLIIAAANPLASPAQLPLEIRQRFMFVEVKWDKDEWVDYMKELGFDNENDLHNLADKIIARSDDTKNWNTLTPRTATKLCVWVRDSCNPHVKSYINNTFGVDVGATIDRIVCNKVVKSPKIQIADKIIEELSEKYIDPDERESNDERSVAIDMAREIVDGNSEDMSGLVDILSKLPEWDQIKEVLSNTKLENDIEF